MPELSEEESMQKNRALEASDLKKKFDEAKKTTLDDLTRGVINYKYLGLDFQKAEGNKLR